MKKIIIILLLFFGSIGSVFSQSFNKIQPIDDLKSEINSPDWMKVIMSLKLWFPELVSATQWETRMSDHFLLNYYIDVNDEDDILFDSFLKDLEMIYSELIKFFHIYSSSKQESLILKTKLVCFIIKTDTERTFGTMVDPNSLFYLMNTKKDPNYINKIRHELAHLVWSRLYGEAPSLFNEGVAVYAEKMSISNSRLADIFQGSKVDINKIPPLTEIAFNENFWKHKGGYTAGGLLVYYLVKKWDWAKLKQLFMLSKFEDTTILDHFSNVYDQSLESVDTEWRDFVNTELSKF